MDFHAIQDPKDDTIIENKALFVVDKDNKSIES